MNLTKLFDTQRILDARIEKEHPRVEGEDRLGKKILALQVELGELVNEIPQVFKFWSNKKNDYEKALKEYVDGLHFILSIGLELPINIKGLEEFSVFDSYPNRAEIFIINKLFYDVKGIVDEDEDDQLASYYRSFQWLLELGSKLGFTWEQIEQAYYDKNVINHTRQDTGY